MSRRIPALWTPAQDAHGPRRHRKSCRYFAYLPDRLAELSLTLTAGAAADIADVERAMSAFDVRTRSGHDLERLARFLLRAEAVASSKIEGLQVNPRRLVRHEASRRRELDGAGSAGGGDLTAEEVLGNVEAMQLAVSTVAAVPAVTVEHVRQIHEALMRHSPHPALAGQIRTTQNWIGGNDFNPCYADFVPPPPEHVGPLLADLCDFVNRDDLPAVVQAALVHAQFETIHPFSDGNGRAGRALIHVVLRRRRLATAFVPPISLVLATRADAYVAGLTAYRYDGELGGPAAAEGIERWLDVFVSAAARATDDAVTLCDRMVELEARWRSELGPRRGSAADRILPFLIAQPVLTAGDVETLLGVSRQAAAQAVRQLLDAGVVTQVGGGQRRRLFEAPEVFAVLTDYERGLATESGNTRSERPRRPVPYRVEP